jgi:hypothetical protein
LKGSSAGSVGGRRDLHARRRHCGNASTSRSSGGCAAWLGETPSVDVRSGDYLVRRDDAPELGSYGGGGALQRATRRAGEEGVRRRDAAGLGTRRTALP